MYKNNLSAFIFFTCFWFLVVILSGSLFSGYKFMDDSGHLVLAARLKEGLSWFDVVYHYVNNDLHERFRPVWAADYALRSVVLKDDFLLLSVQRVLQTVFTCFFLYLFARKTGTGHRIGILFAMLVTVGQQSVIAWALAPSEGIGMLFLSLALLFMAKAVLDETGRVLYETLFMLFTLLMSLSKESFIFFIPALFIWRTWLYAQKHSLGLWPSLVRNLPAGILLAVITLWELYMLISLSTSFNYAGADAGAGIGAYLRTFVFFTVFSISGLAALAGFTMLLARRRLKLSEWSFPLLLLAAIVVPQVVIYTKSGIFDRYFLPGAVAFAFLIIHQLHTFEKDVSTYRLNKTVALLLSFTASFTLATGLALALSSGIRMLLIRAMYAFKGNVVQSMNPLSMVYERSNGNIRTIGIGIAIIGLLIVVACIAMIVFKVRTFRLYHAFMSLVLLTLLVNAAATFSWARKFAREGETVNRFLQAIITHTRKEDAILVVSDPWVHYEGTGSGVPCYLKLKGDRDKLFAYPVFINPGDSSAEKSETIRHAYPPFVPQEFSCLALFPEAETGFLATPHEWFNPDNYSRIALDNGYVVYALRNRQ